MRLHTICLISVFTCRTLLADTTLTYTLPKDGRASLAVYNSDGQIVRTLLTGKPLAKGKHTITWDGLDRYGHALPAGDYTWKLLATEGRSSSRRSGRTWTRFGKRPRAIISRPMPPPLMPPAFTGRARSTKEGTGA
jgi:hypothetical protein